MFPGAAVTVYTFPHGDRALETSCRPDVMRIAKTPLRRPPSSALPVSFTSPFHWVPAGPTLADNDMF